MRKIAIQLFVFAFFIKGIYFFGSHFVFTHQLAENHNSNGFYTLGKDIEDHFIPLENWWNEGSYFRTLSTGKVVFAARPPGYAPFYLPMYVFTNGETARSLFTLFTFLMDVAGCVALFFLIFRFTSSKPMALVGFIVFVFMPFISVYSNYSKTEPISTALIIFSLLALLNGLEKQNKLMLLVSGLIIADAVLIRPAIALFVILFSSIVLVQLKFNWKKSLYFLILLGLPIIILVGSWILRSSLKENRFIPIVDGQSFATPETRALFKFISETNGDIQGWIPGSEAAWFAREGTINYNEMLSKSNPFDPTMFNETFTFDSLLALREVLWQTNQLEAQNQNGNSKFIKKSENLLELYKTERTIWHRIKTETAIFLRFIFIKFTHGTILEKSTFWYQIGKVYWLGWYYLVVLGGLAGLILGIIKRENWIIILGVYCVFYMSVHANILGLIENRYLAAIMPLFAMLSAYFIYETIRIFANKIPYFKNMLIHAENS